MKTRSHSASGRVENISFESDASAKDSSLMSTKTPGERSLAASFGSQITTIKKPGTISQLSGPHSSLAPFPVSTYSAGRFGPVNLSAFCQGQSSFEAIASDVRFTQPSANCTSRQTETTGLYKPSIDLHNSQIDTDLLKDEFALEEEELRLRRKRHELSKVEHSSRLRSEHSGSRDDTQENPGYVDRLEGVLRSLVLGHDLPKLQLEPFDGSPAHFIEFLNSFEMNVSSKVCSDRQRLSYLIQYCEGEAKEAIRHCSMMLPHLGYQMAIKILKEQFGRPHMVIDAITKDLYDGPMIRSEDISGLQSLVRKMTSCNITLMQLGREADLNSTVNIMRIVKRLPKSLQHKWAERAGSIYERDLSPKFEDLLQFLSKWLNVANTEYGRLASEGKRTAHVPGNQTFRVSATQQHNTSATCALCNLNHSISSCPTFISLPIKERWEKLKANGCCFRCLKLGHRSKDCHVTSTCDVNGCIGKHHRMLHQVRSPVKTQIQPHNVCSLSESECSKVQLGFIPVRLSGPNGSAMTYAFLDDGSDCTLIKRSLADNLGLKIKPFTTAIRTLHGTRVVKCGKTSARLDAVSDQLNIEISSAVVVDCLPVERATSCSHTALKLGHLSDLPINRLEDPTVGILIGCDIPKAHWVLDSRMGNSMEPFANKTPLGWVIRGPMRTKKDFLNVNSISTHSLEECFEQLYNSEFQDVGDSEETRDSVEDSRALQLVETSAKLVAGHYEIAVPWKTTETQLPDNRNMVMKRNNSLKHRLLRDDDLRRKYVRVMESHIEAEHVRIATFNNHRWFIPHHPVINPKKPDKLRIVFDCAANFGGYSLNEALLQGPDWTNNLVGVLLRFRRYPIAVSADIAEMFLQVRLREEDKWAFSFLWWPAGNLEMDPVAYEWNVHPFGARSSPFCANYALRRTALDNKDKFSKEVIDAIGNDFYVDDYLASFETESQALNCVTELRTLLTKGGFHIVKWTSNRQQVLDEVPISERATHSSNVDLVNCNQRTLGIKWLIQEDAFTFDLNQPNETYSRRSVLAYIASIYDPLGFIAPCLLQGKAVLQALCRDHAGWDTPLTEDRKRQWVYWCKSLRGIKTMRIPRCFATIGKSHPDVQLHAFSDASELGYGMVCYLRYGYTNSTQCRFVFGKSRVAPLKAVSIPRLELTAALLSVKIVSTLVKELKISLSSLTFWTDSAVVLAYIRNTKTRFATFVDNRVRRIRQLSQVSQWRYVPTKENPADLASRGIDSSCPKLSTWLNGPSFLSNDESTWPLSHRDLPDVDHELEYKRTVMSITSNHSDNWFHDMSSRCSSWTTLLRRVVWITRFKKYLIARFKDRSITSNLIGNITIDELKQATTDVIRLTQRRKFTCTRVLRDDGTYVYNALELRRLRPIEQDGVLYLGGRVSASHSPAMLPILPSRDHVTDLVIRQHHLLAGHAGASHVLGSVRRQFWIIKGMAAVRRTLRNCFECRRLLAPPSQQIMAPLPQFRTEGCCHPFEHCGIDYFGPFTVRIGRKEFKRFGCLFTCMQSRAIHIEVAQDLSTDSFLMALIRFISRRGSPKKIYSDNGSNFVGADSELKRLIRSFDQQRITDGLHSSLIEWNFNPPSASHRGGVWERMIRSVRKVLSFLVKHQPTTEDVLLTCLAEAERIVNDRPLIPVYDDPDKPTTLTPNDLLLLRNNDGLCNDEIPLREYYTKKWRQVQYLANLFWKRWRSDYLPTLQAHHKWLLPQRNIQQGDLVLLCKTDAPRGYWPKGVVCRVFPGLDGRIRTVEVKTKSGVVQRDVRSLCLLEGCQE